MLRILSEPGIAQATFFFRFYLHQALSQRWGKGIVIWICSTIGAA